MKQYEIEMESKIELISQHLPWLNDAAANWRTFYTGTVTLEMVIYWLLQFQDTASTRFAIDLLKHVNFVDTNRLVALLSRAWKKIPEEVQRNLVVAPIGKSYDSSSIVGYSFAKNSGLSEAELTTRWIDVNSYGLNGCTSPIALIDDNLTSGTQLIRYFSEMSPDFTSAREHFLQPLTAEQLERLKSTKIYVIVALELGSGRDEVIKELKTMGFAVEVFSGGQELTPWLDFGGPIWSSEQDSLEAKKVLMSIGESILQDKKWQPEVVNLRVLGYGNLQRLTIFEHNVPKSLITAFWKYGNVGDRHWIPLFPERREWAQYESEIRSLIPELKFIANLICSGTYGKVAPVCSACFNLCGHPTKAVKAFTPNNDMLRRITSFITQQISPLPHMELRDESGERKASLSIKNVIGPNNQQRGEYNRHVDEYNAQISIHTSEVSKAVAKAAKLVTLPLRIYNDGSCPATDVALKIEVPDGVAHCFKLPSLPQMPDPPSKPSTRGWNSLVGMSEIFKAPQAMDVMPSNIKITHDRGKTYLNIFFGKILQRTFRDNELKYLVVQPETKVLLPYEIIYNEATRPVEGTFVVETVTSEEPIFQPDILTEWFGENLMELITYCRDT